MKKLLILLTFTLSMSTTYAQQYKVIYFPDGTHMVCWYVGTMVSCN